MKNAAAVKQETSVLTTRPPIVVVLGHIDHGKSSILDAIRKTRLVEKEAGGITQHIGAYQVTVSPPSEPSSRAERGISRDPSVAPLPQDDFAPVGRKITFIDTPGHEAFSKMRGRGARAADIAVLVVAADEGVKPQTEEAIRIAHETDTPLVAAINKIDKPNADPERVKRELAQAGILLEGLGGQVPAVPLSAKTGQGIPELLETILLVAELEDLKTDPAGPASGVVIESHLDPRRGATATLLITDGRLRRGDALAIGAEIATVKIFENFLGAAIDVAEAAEPVRMVGFERVPPLGERFQAFGSRGEAEAHVSALPPLRPGPPRLTAAAAEGETVVNLVVKADVLGSLEAIEAAVAGLGAPAVTIRVLKGEVGGVTESDIMLAAAGGPSFVVGFRVKVPPPLAELAERHRVRVVTGGVIYELLDALKQAIRGVVPSRIERRDLGRAKILAVFRGRNGKQIVGGRVESGALDPGTRFNLERNGAIIGSGRIIELQSNRQPVGAVNEGQEFGVMAEADLTIAVGDTLLVFEEVAVSPEL